MNESSQIGKFYERLKRLNNDVGKCKTRTISTKEFRENAARTYETWKMEIYPILKKLDLLSSKSLSSFDNNFEVFYKESNRRVANVNMLRTLLGQMTNSFFSAIIIPLRTKSPVLESSLLRLLNHIADEDERDYIREALHCLSIDARRAAIVLGWIGAMWSLHKRIETKGFSVFNKCYEERYSKSGKRGTKTIKKIEDFEYYPDNEVLLVSEDMGILDRGERRILEKCLELRNTCGHPSKYVPGPSETSVFFERLVNILLSK